MMGGFFFNRNLPGLVWNLCQVHSFLLNKLLHEVKLPGDLRIMLHE